MRIHHRRVLITFGANYVDYMESPNVIWHMSSTCPWCLQAVKKPQETCRASSRSKKCKSRMTRCLAAHTGRVRYQYRTCPVLVRQQGTKCVPTTTITLDGGQVMNHVLDCKI